jgi:hypothetical protein
MIDFTLELEQRLKRAAEREATRTPLSRTAARIRALGIWRNFLVGVCGAGVVAALVVLVGRGSERAQALPVLAQPRTDVSQTNLRERVVLKRNRADLKEARAIPTPNGSGYVFPAQDGTGLCLTLPLPAVGGHGESCASNGDIEQRGLALLTSQADGRSVFVAVLPAGATATLRGTDGTATPLQVNTGVVSVSLGKNESVTLRIQGKDNSFSALPSAPPCNHVTRTVPSGTSPPPLPPIVCPR